jgi:hypothetical protein
MGRPCQAGKAFRHLEMRGKCDKILPTPNFPGGAVTSAFRGKRHRHGSLWALLENTVWMNRKEA